MKYFLPLVVLFASACTSLGPMPATTGVSAVPIGRPGVELQAGVMPAYYLSDATTSDDDGPATRQLAAVLEPDRLLGIPGLIVGARTWGQTGDRLGEPFVGYRTKVDAAGAISVAGIVYGTHTSAADDGASYKATRFGGELAIDARVLELASWLSVHAQGAASVTAMSATGQYCTDASGEGIDCSDGATVVDGKLSGVYPAATGTLALDFGRGATGAFQSARLAFLGAAGEMPTLNAGEQRSARTYESIGLSLSLGFGADR